MTFMNPAAPLWGQAFRPLFLLAAGFSSLALALWGLALQGQQLSIMELGTFWHSHEMLFGFAAAVIAGFLLTAVQNWTGRRATNGLPLLILTLVWLAGRGLMLFAPLVPWWLTALVDLAFLPLVAWFFWQLLYAVRQQRNYFFVPVLVLMTAVNAAMHWGNAHHNMGLVLWGSHAVSLMVVLLITIVGGRVMPMFTANGTMTPKVEAIPWLEKVVLGGMWLVVAVFLTTLDQYLPAPVLAAVLIVVALAQALRVARWRIQVTWKVIALGLLVCAAGAVVAGAALSGLTHYVQYRSACADGRGYWRHDSGHDCPGITGAFRAPAGTTSIDGGRVCPAVGRGTGAYSGGDSVAGSDHRVLQCVGAALGVGVRHFCGFVCPHSDHPPPGWPTGIILLSVSVIPSGRPARPMCRAFYFTLTLRSFYAYPRGGTGAMKLIWINFS